MLAAAHVRCPRGKQSQVDSCWRRDDPPSQRMPPLGCAHTSIMAVTSNPSHHRLRPTSAGWSASVAKIGTSTRKLALGNDVAMLNDHARRMPDPGD